MGATHARVGADVARGPPCADWWANKAALVKRRDGATTANGSVALEAALAELPSSYKARGREAHGERYIDRAGHVRSGFLRTHRRNSAMHAACTYSPLNMEAPGCPGPGLSVLCSGRWLLTCGRDC